MLHACTATPTKNLDAVSSVQGQNVIPPFGYFIHLHQTLDLPGMQLFRLAGRQCFFRSVAVVLAADHSTYFDRSARIFAHRSQAVHELYCIPVDIGTDSAFDDPFPIGSTLPSLRRRSMTAASASIKSCVASNCFISDRVFGRVQKVVKGFCPLQSKLVVL
jgi:hypothetical protein